MSPAFEPVETRTAEMLDWDADLRISAANLYLDSRQSRPACFISHAHADHLGEHIRTIATPATLAIADYRIQKKDPGNLNHFRETLPLPIGDSVFQSGKAELRACSAGHVLGSAMLHVTSGEGTLLYTGDFKLRPSRTVPLADPRPADVLVTECTYGQPAFRFPDARQVADQLVELVRTALSGGEQPIVLGYSLGKAQELVRILTDAHVPVTCHGAVAAMNHFYEQFDVPLGTYRRYRAEDFHGSAALDLAERGVLVAPPQVARSAFVSRFPKSCTIMMTGWALTSGAKYRYGVDHVLPLSDHADFDELLELIDRVNPKQIFTHHGPRSFADLLRARGLNATPARPDTQLSLF